MIIYNDEEYLTFKELCDLFRVSPNTMRKSLKELGDKIQILHFTSSRKFYNTKSIIRAMKRKQKK